MSSRSNAYQSYLLRLWREERNGKWVWRVSLQSTQETGRCYFASLDELFVFLREQVSATNKEQR